MDWIYFWISLVLVLIWAIAATWQRDVAKTDLFLAQSEIRSLESAVNSLRVDLVEERKDIRNLEASAKQERQRADANYEKAQQLKRDLDEAQRKLRFVRRVLDQPALTKPGKVVGIDVSNGKPVMSADIEPPWITSADLAETE